MCVGLCELDVNENLVLNEMCVLHLFMCVFLGRESRNEMSAFVGFRVCDDVHFDTSTPLLETKCQAL